MSRKKLFIMVFMAFVLFFMLNSCQYQDILRVDSLANRAGNQSELPDGSRKNEVFDKNDLTDKDLQNKDTETGSLPENDIKEVKYLISEVIPKELDSLISDGINKAAQKSEKIKIRRTYNTDDLSNHYFKIDFCPHGKKAENKIGSYVLVFVSNFYNSNDNIVFDDFLKFWQGDSAALSYITGKQTDPDIVLSPALLRLLENVFGKYNGENLKITRNPEEISALLYEYDNTFSIIPFEDIEKNFKVFDINGHSVFDKKNESTGDYALNIAITADGDTDSDFKTLISDLDPEKITNKDESALTTVMMTGCTALVRGTATRMEQKGLTYPGEKIADTLRSADITHISNEITFVEGNPRDKEDRIIFSSDPKYIELLRFVGTDVVELTGNHMNDYGPKWMVYTLELYENEGWQFFAGGRDLQESYKPAKFDINGNKIAFLGCNQFGPASYWATETKAGAAPPNYDDYEEIITGLKKEGYIVIFTFAHEEIYDYKPSPGQVRDFRRMADAGADIVSGSQAHHPQAIEFYNDSLIFYGLGNLFFDQMYNKEVRQGMIANHIFYKGKYINTVIITTMLEDYCQPRLADIEERYDILTNVFKASKLKK